MTFAFQIGALAFLLFLGTLGMMEVGRQTRRWRLAVELDPDGAGLGAIEGAIFTILGLLLAFSFSGAADRFDARKRLVGEEANRIGTAWLRLELLPVEERSQLQGLFRDYLDARIESYRQDVDSPASAEARTRASELQVEIWSSAVAACPKGIQPSACTLLLSSLNEVIDVTTTRLVASWIHPPTIVYAMLFSLVLAAALLTGYGTGRNAQRNWLHRLLFAGAITSAVFVTLDIEYPRAGFIRVDAVDVLLVELRSSFNE